VLRILLCCFLFTGCISKYAGKTGPDYSVQYLGTQQELDNYTSKLVSTDYTYKTITHEDGVFEVQYKKIKNK